MLGRNGNVAYVRYNSQGRIVPGGPILSRQRPKVGNWQPLSLVTGNSVTSNSLRAFVRIDAYGRVVASSLLLLSGAPSDADSGTSWLEINATYRPYVPGSTTTTTTTAIPISTTTTTTSSTTSTTSTTTTQVPTTTTTTTTSQISTTTTTTSSSTSTTSTTSTTTTVPPATTTTTTTGVLDCTLDAVVNPTFVGGPVSCTIEQVCSGDVRPYFLFSNPVGGSGEYCFLTVEGILIEYETALPYATIPFDLPVWPNTLSKMSPPGWPAGKQFWIVLADANNHNNKTVFPIVIVECPALPPSNTVFMKFDIL
jgi:hypothetical protein